jgi:hypothetical protein
MRISLTELGLSDRRTQAVAYFEEALAGMGEEALGQPTFFKDIVDRCTLTAQERGVTNGAVRKFRGEWFEFAVAAVLIDARVLPFYRQTAESVAVPLVRRIAEQMRVAMEERSPLLGEEA